MFFKNTTTSWMKSGSRRVVDKSDKSFLKAKYSDGGRTTPPEYNAVPDERFNVAVVNSELDMLRSRVCQTPESKYRFGNPAG